MKSAIDILNEQAIETAISGNWRKALSLNKKIIYENSNDLSAYLRLGFAYLQLGNLSSSRKAYLRAIKIQPGNQIALNNLERIRILKKKDQNTIKKQKESLCLDPILFLNIPGRTKVVSLINLGQISILAKLKVGLRVYLKIKKRRIETRNQNNEYIGALPDDISKRLILFIKAKAQYIAYIKEVSKKNVDVFIKEEKKGRKFKRFISFPKNFQEDLKIMIDRDEDTSQTEEEEIGKDESPVDLDKLAEEVEEKDFYTESPLEEEKDDFEE
jgi:tetratricopeptide (TPR) repeat protein